MLHRWARVDSFIECFCAGLAMPCRPQVASLTSQVASLTAALAAAEDKVLVGEGVRRKLHNVIQVTVMCACAWWGCCRKCGTRHHCRPLVCSFLTENDRFLY
jgi:hypothetical protein